MKRSGRFLFALVCGAFMASLISSDACLAQRGRGGGKISRAGSSMGRSMPSRSPSLNRSPSMSRPSIRPSTPTSRPSMTRPSISRPSTGRPSTGRPSIGKPSAGKPSTLPSNLRPSNARPSLPSGGGSGRPSIANQTSRGELNDFLNLNRPTTRPSTQGGAARDFLDNRPSTKPILKDRPGIGDRPGYRPADHRVEHRRPNSRPPGWRPPGLRPPGWRPPYYRPPVILPVYGRGYWGRYPYYRWGWVNYPNRNWWAWATAGAVTSWLVNSPPQPVYCDYGTTIYYEGDKVYNEGDVIATADEYAAEAKEIAASVPEKTDPKQVEWLPLGVFALGSNDESSIEDSTMFLQLAVSKEGIIAGTFQNLATDKSFEVEGTVDEESQRAAWGPVGKSSPIMETQLYNLTENEVGTLVHFEDDGTQQWTLVRIDDPEKKSSDR